MYIHTHIYIYIYIHTHIYIHIYIHTHIYILYMCKCQGCRSVPQRSKFCFTQGIFVLDLSPHLHASTEVGLTFFNESLKLHLVKIVTVVVSPKVALCFSNNYRAID